MIKFRKYALLGAIALGVLGATDANADVLERTKPSKVVSISTGIRTPGCMKAIQIIRETLEQAGQLKSKRVGGESEISRSLAVLQNHCVLKRPAVPTTVKPWVNRPQEGRHFERPVYRRLDRKIETR